MNNQIHDNLKKYEVELLPPLPPHPTINWVRKFGTNLLYLSGTGPNIDGETKYLGKIGSELSIEEGQKAARMTAINILSELEEQVGLENIKQIVKMIVFVSSTPTFTQQPVVANTASQLFIDILGENCGKAARSAVGVAALPGNIPVEIELIAELKN